MRTVQHCYDKAEFDVLCQATREATDNALEKVLAYLQNWAYDSYPVVKLFLRPDGEITACYYKTDATDGRADYVIGAIYDIHLGRYSTHS